MDPRDTSPRFEDGEAQDASPSLDVPLPEQNERPDTQTEISVPLGSVAINSPSSTETETETQEYSVEQRAVLWGHDVMQGFKDSLKARGGKNKTQGDRIFVRSQLRPKDGVSVIQNPEFFLTAFDMWRAQALDGNPRARVLVDTAAEQARAYIKEHWKTLDHNALAGYVKIAASQRLSAGTATHLLKAYFEGPNNQKEQVDAYYALAHTILDVSEDPKAFPYASAIANFQTNVLPEGSVFQTGYTAAYYASADDLATLEKARIAGRVADAAARVLQTSVNDSERAGSPLLNPTNPRFKIALRQAIARVVKVGDPEVIQRMNDLVNTSLAEALNSSAGYSTTETYEQDNSTIPAWLRDITEYSNDPLVERFASTIGPRSAVKRLARLIEKAEDGYTVARTEHLTLPRGVVIDVFIPHGLLPAEERAFTQHIIETAAQDHADAEIDIASAQAQHRTTAAVYPSKITGKNGQPMYYVYRQGGEFDTLRSHPLNQLLWVGLPYAEAQADYELIEGLVEVQDDMEKYQHRFLNRRGVRINFEDTTQLGSRGYTHIVFREDSKNAQNTVVELGHTSRNYRYGLDTNFNLTLGDKEISSSRFRNQVHYATLLLLRDYICGIVLESEEGELASTSAGPAARIDYLRYLPNGQNFSPTASQLFLGRRKKDLLTKSEERKRVDPLGRNSTYVREVEQNNPALPPLKIFVNPDDFLYHKILANGFRLPPDLM